MTGPSKRRSSQSRYLLETTSNVSQPGVPSDCTCSDHYECGSQQRVASTHNWFFGAHRSQPPLIPEERKVKFSACPACRKHNGEIVAKSEVKANLPGGALNMDQLIRNQYSRSSLSDVISSLPSELSNTKSDRILCFDSLASSVGLNSVISQLYGGPLEKVIYVSEERSNLRIIQAHFFQPKDARSFYNFTKTGRFLVNGKVYFPHWANAGIANIYSLPKMIHDEMVYNGARRCLTLSRKANSLNCEGSDVGTKLKHYNVHLNTSIDKIKRDFSKYGLIIAVCPLIAPTVSLSIQFADVRSAIRTKKLFDRQSDSALSRSYAGWVISYGKDPTDRKCPTPV